MMRAGKDYGVEVVVAYENKRVGQVIYPPGTLRQRLIQTGRCRALTAEHNDPVATKPNQSKPILKLR